MFIQSIKSYAFNPYLSIVLPARGHPQQKLDLFKKNKHNRDEYTESQDFVTWETDEMPFANERKKTPSTAG
jgi:hypothetical protein